MPYKFETDKIPLPRDRDRRVKLTDEQRQAIRDNPEQLSQRALAARYGVSKRLIGFIQKPETLAANLQRRQERGGWQQYYNPETWAETMRNHRRYKQKVLKGDTN